MDWVRWYAGEERLILRTLSLLRSLDRKGLPADDLSRWIDTLEKDLWACRRAGGGGRICPATWSEAALWGAGDRLAGVCFFSLVRAYRCHLTKGQVEGRDPCGGVCERARELASDCRERLLELPLPKRRAMANLPLLYREAVEALAEASLATGDGQGPWTVEAAIEAFSAEARALLKPRAKVAAR